MSEREESVAAVNNNGQRVIVTGGASGIGRASATRLRRQGAQVATLDITDPGDDPVFIQTDVSDEKSVEAAISAAVTYLGGLDGVVNVAGIQRSGPVQHVEQTDWDTQMAVNARSCFLTAKHSIEHLRNAGGGAIVMTASNAGLKGFPGMSAYSASKGAIISLTRSMALELAPDNIRVNCVCPGWVDTPFNDPAIQFRGGSEAHDLEIQKSVPLGRQATPDEIAVWMTILVSEASAYMTGQSLAIDGGAGV